MESSLLKLSSSGSLDDEDRSKEGEGNVVEDNGTNEIEQADMSIPEKFLSFQIGECEHSKYKIKNAKPDGNFMYHSVIGALGLDIQVLAFKADLANFCTKKYPDNLELISKIRTDKIYGDDEALLEISDFLKINICIHYLEKGGRVGYFLYTQAYASKTIHLTYSINPLHYNCLELESIDIEEIEEAAEVEKLRKENVSLQQQLKHQSQDTLITLNPIIEIISKTMRDEQLQIRTTPDTSSSTSKDSDFPIDHEGKVR
ncbi:hypothetical protein HCN44_003373 [Aphidius gifuensis]|uniref:Uncharacterized protein n=1 Tax=Aphidius gifuensis TaxID=684658 RepID=A0A834XXV1_APHGI|nr:hypothetical protein HCN44_003373 [Aphidius gifuensis]